MDLNKKLITQLYTTLTDDATLKAAMGGTVRLYYTMAKPDAIFPYLVHLIRFTQPTWSPETEGQYLIDIWSDSENADEILAIRSQLVTLIDELYYAATDEHDGAWLWLQSAIPIPESAENIWHYNITFNMKVLVLSEVEWVRR